MVKMFAGKVLETIRAESLLLASVIRRLERQRMSLIMMSVRGVGEYWWRLQLISRRMPALSPAVRLGLGLVSPLPTPPEIEHCHVSSTEELQTADTLS